MSQAHGGEQAARDPACATLRAGWSRRWGVCTSCPWGWEWPSSTRRHDVQRPLRKKGRTCTPRAQRAHVKNTCTTATTPTGAPSFLLSLFPSFATSLSRTARHVPARERRESRHSTCAAVHLSSFGMFLRRCFRSGYLRGARRGTDVSLCVDGGLTCRLLPLYFLKYDLVIAAGRVFAVVFFSDCHTVCALAFPYVEVLFQPRSIGKVLAQVSHSNVVACWYSFLPPGHWCAVLWLVMVFWLVFSSTEPLFSQLLFPWADDLSLPPSRALARNDSLHRCVPTALIASETAGFRCYKGHVPSLPPPARCSLRWRVRIVGRVSAGIPCHS